MRDLYKCLHSLLADLVSLPAGVLLRRGAAGRAYRTLIMQNAKHPLVDLDEVISRLYGSLHENAGPDEMLRILADALGSHISGLHSENLAHGTGSLMLLGSLTSDEYLALAERYARRWREKNLWMERSMDGFQSQGFQHGEAVVTKQELHASQYFQHFLKPLDIYFGLGIRIGGDPDSLSVASFHRGRNGRGFDADDIALVKALQPHLCNTFAIHQRLHRSESEAQSLRRILDGARVGMMVLDIECSILRCNVRAKSLLSQAGAFGASTDAKPAFTRPVRQKIAALVVDTLLGGAGATRSMRIDESTGQTSKAIVLHMHPLPSALYGKRRKPPHVLVHVSSLRQSGNAQHHIGILRPVLGLTQAEARIAIALREHVDVERAAGAIGIATGTARSHLKRIYQKLGIERQGALLQLVERVLGMSP